MSFYVYSKVFIIYIIVWHYSVIFILFSLKKPWKIENGAKLFQTYDGICWNFCEQQQQKCARHKITYHDGMGKLMEFHPLLKFLPSSSILSTKKNIVPENSLGCHFLLRCSESFNNRSTTIDERIFNHNLLILFQIFTGPLPFLGSVSSVFPRLWQQLWYWATLVYLPQEMNDFWWCWWACAVFWVKYF